MAQEQVCFGVYGQAGRVNTYLSNVVYFASELERQEWLTAEFTPGDRHAVSADLPELAGLVAQFADAPRFRCGHVFLGESRTPEILEELAETSCHMCSERRLDAVTEVLDNSQGFLPSNREG